jgi:hypothetical protein
VEVGERYPQKCRLLGAITVNEEIGIHFLGTDDGLIDFFIHFGVPYVVGSL